MANTPQVTTSFYPYMVEIPLSSYLLHEDLKHHNSIAIERQTADLIGSQSQIQSALSKGLSESNSLLSSIDRSMAESSAYQSEILDNVRSFSDKIECTNERLGEIGDTLDSIDEGVRQLRVTVRHVGDKLERSIKQVNSNVTLLNCTSANIARMMADSEFTWAHEQARTAERAARVSDLDTAELSISRAVNGGGGHVGAPTHAEFIVLYAEILLRRGDSRLDDAHRQLTACRLYLELEEGEGLHARYDFAMGTYHLNAASARGEPKELETAKSLFRSASRHQAYSVVGKIFEAVAAHKAGVADERVIPVLKPLLKRSPTSSIELSRHRGKTLSKRVVDNAILQSTKELYIEAIDMFEYQSMLEPLLKCIKTLKKAKRVSTPVLNELNEARSAIDKYIPVRDRLTAENQLLSAYVLKEKQKALCDRITTLIKKL